MKCEKRWKIFDPHKSVSYATIECFENVSLSPRMTRTFALWPKPKSSRLWQIKCGTPHVMRQCSCLNIITPIPTIPFPLSGWNRSERYGLAMCRRTEVDTTTTNSQNVPRLTSAIANTATSTSVLSEWLQSSTEICGQSSQKSRVAILVNVVKICVNPYPNLVNLCKSL